MLWAAVGGAVDGAVDGIAGGAAAGAADGAAAGAAAGARRGGRRCAQGSPSLAAARRDPAALLHVRTQEAVPVPGLRWTLGIPVPCCDPGVVERQEATQVPRRYTSAGFAVDLGRELCRAQPGGREPAGSPPGRASRASARARAWAPAPAGRRAR